MSSTSNRVVRRTARATVALVILLAIGCGGGEEMPATTPVTGKVSYKGSPLTKGMITFTPIDKGSETRDMARRPATGGIAEDGSFTLGTFAAGDGAIPGDYAVMVVSFKNDPTDEEISKGATYESAIPAKYTSEQTTDLKATVPAEGSLEVDFDLK